MMATSSALRARVSPTVSTRRASPPPSARVAAPRAAAAAVATTTSPVVARAAALLGDDLSVLSAAVEAAELVDALTTGEPKTVFAPCGRRVRQGVRGAPAVQGGDPSGAFYLTLVPYDRVGVVNADP